MGVGFENMIAALQALVDGLTGPGGGGATIQINAIDADSFRQFLASDGGDALMQELGLRRQEQLVDIIAGSMQGVEET